MQVAECIAGARLRIALQFYRPFMPKLAKSPPPELLIDSELQEVSE
jgi:hypothetical protein